MKHRKFDYGLRATIALGMILSITFLMVDILFGSQTNIVGYVVGVIQSFTAQGIVELVALIVFIPMFNRS